MTIAVAIPNGIMTLLESKAVCQHCNYKFSFDEIDAKWIKRDKAWIRMKCKCKKYIGITSNIQGDFVAYCL